MLDKRKTAIQFILWGVFFNGLIASLISAQVISSAAFQGAWLSTVYMVLQQIGHFQFFALLMALPAILLAIIYPNRRFITSLALVLFILFIVLVVLDYQVYKLYRFHLNTMVWNLVFGGAVEEILVFDVSNVVTVAGLLAMVIFVQLLILFMVGKRRDQTSSRFGWLVATIVLLVQLSGQVIYAWSDARYDTDLIGLVRYVPHPQALTAKRFLRKRGWAEAVEGERKIKLAASGKFKYPSNKLNCDADSSQPNILFIVSDGLRFDMFNQQVMPHWTGFAQKSQVFENHMSTGNATRFGIFGLFSGLFGNYWFDALRSGKGSVLIAELKKRQYQFGFFTTAGLKSPEFDKAIFNQVAEFIPPKMKGKSVVERDYEITRRAKTFMTKNKARPFFGFVFFDAPHAYVYPPQDAKFTPALESLNYFKLNNETDPEPFLNRYKNSVGFNDRLTGEILQTLEAENMLSNTIVIMTGDHGQESNETRTNSWGHNSNFSKYQISVPMVVHWPGKAAATYSHLTSHVDLVPTIMSKALGCTNPVSDYSNGQVIFDPAERNYVLSNNWNNSAIVTDNVIRVFPKVGTAETFDSDHYQQLDSSLDLKAIELNSLSEISRFYR